MFASSSELELRSSITDNSKQLQLHSTYVTVVVLTAKWYKHTFFYFLILHRSCLLPHFHSYRRMQLRLNIHCTYIHTSIMCILGVHGSACTSTRCFDEHTECDVGRTDECICQPYYYHDGSRCRRTYIWYIYSVFTVTNLLDHLYHQVTCYLK